LLPTGFDIDHAVSNRDGTKVAFAAEGSPAAGQPQGTGSYIVDADGSGQPSKLNVSNLPSPSTLLLLRRD
jgi:hypothetical protein